MRLGAYSYQCMPVGILGQEHRERRTMSESLVSEPVNATASSLELASRTPASAFLPAQRRQQRTHPPGATHPGPWGVQVDHRAPRPLSGYLAIPRGRSRGRSLPDGKRSGRRAPGGEACGGAGDPENEEGDSREGAPVAGGRTSCQATGGVGSCGRACACTCRGRSGRGMADGGGERRGGLRVYLALVAIAILFPA